MTDITTGDLLIYMDGAASPELTRLVENSPQHMQRVRELTRLQARLQTRLFRAECPEPLTLGEYHQGLLPPGQAAVIRRHLVLCPYCKAELAQLENYMVPETSVLERVRKVVASLLSSDQAGRLAPGLVLQGVRGGEAPQIYSAENVQIALSVQADTRRPERKTVAGLVIGEETAGWQVRLLKDGEQLADTLVDEIGNFVFADLSAGEYEIRLMTPEEEIQIPVFHVE
jgi:hypothetical protein